MGQKDRIELASYCYEVVGRQLLQARKAFNKKLGDIDANRKWKLAEAYCEGFVASLEYKISNFVVDDAEKQLVEEKLYQMFPSAKEGKFKEKELSKSELRAKLEGQDAGEQVNLHRPMNGQETIKIRSSK